MVDYDSPENHLPTTNSSNGFDQKQATNIYPAVDAALFAEDIARKMKVPMQIRPYDDESMRPNTESFSRAVFQMNVPDRILVAGNERHVGFRENRPRELELDDMLYGFRSEPSVSVLTPPRVLTMNQYDYPAAMGNDVDPEGPIIAPMSASVPSDSEATLEHLSDQANRNMSVQRRISRTDGSALRMTNVRSQSSLKAALPDTPSSRLLVELYKRVELLERESHRRYLRELVTYAALIGFVALKAVSYLLKR